MGYDKFSHINIFFVCKIGDRIIMTNSIHGLILLCTGFSETMSVEKATSLGINGFLLKPIVMKDLSHKIKEVLDKK
jgi:YesN/AraC family two-component response regulator